MAGVKGKSGGARPNTGGARPGAGRKSQSTLDYQATMRSRFEALVTQEDWDKVVWTALAQAKSGDKAAREWLAAWIVGKVPEEVVHSGDADNPIVMVTADDLHEAVKRARGE